MEKNREKDFVDPVKKVDNVVKMLHEADPKIEIEMHYAHDKDEEYSYLDGDDVCIEIKNPYNETVMYIDLIYVFGVSYLDFNEEYYPYMDEYREFINSVKSFLKNESCIATLYYNNDEDWLSSIIIDKEKIDQAPKTIFSDIYKDPESLDKIKKQGGKIKFDFWNPQYNKEKEI